MRTIKLFAMMLAIMLIGIVPTPAIAQESDTESVMHQFSIALTGDPDSALELLSDDIEIQIIPPPPGETGVWTGAEEARAFLGFTQSQNASRELVGCWFVNGSVVSGTVMVTANHFVTWGVDPVEHLLEAVVENGKITSWTSTMFVDERERVAAGREAFQAAQQHKQKRAEEIQFFEENHLFTRDSGATSQNPNGTEAEKEQFDTVEWHWYFFGKAEENKAPVTGSGPSLRFADKADWQWYISQRNSGKESSPATRSEEINQNGEQPEWERGISARAAAESQKPATPAEGRASDIAGRCGGYTSTFRTDSPMYGLIP